MRRPNLSISPPKTARLAHRDLARGLRDVWLCALFASGADVFGGDCELAVVIGEIVELPAGRWRVVVGVVWPGQPARAPVRSVHEGRLGVVVMASVYALADAVEIEVPPGLAWTDALRGRVGQRPAARLEALGRRGTRPGVRRPEARGVPARKVA